MAKCPLVLVLHLAVRSTPRQPNVCVQLGEMDPVCRKVPLRVLNMLHSTVISGNMT